MVDANGDALMEKINRVAAEMRAASPSNKKDLGKPKAACGIEGPAIKEGRIVGGVEATEHAWPWQVALFIDDESHLPGPGVLGGLNSSDDPSLLDGEALDSAGSLGLSEVLLVGWG